MRSSSLPNLRALARRGVSGGEAHMVAGTAASALGAYIFQLIAGRVLGADDFAPIAILWTLQFLLITVFLLPIEQLTIRRATLGERAPRRLALVVGALAVATAAFAAATRSALFTGSWGFVPVAAALTVTYGTFAVVRGRLAGADRYREYGLVTGAEPVARLLAAGVVLAVGASSLGFAWAMAIAGLPALLWWHRPDQPDPAEPTVGAGRFLANYISANAAAQTALAAGPLAVAAVGGTAAEVSIATVTTTLLRTPLTLSYHLLARVLTRLTKLEAAGERGAGRFTRWVALVGGTAAAPLGLLGAWLGPPVVALLFGEEFRPPATFTGMVLVGVVLALASLILQQAPVARGATIELAAAWWGGLLTGLVVLIAVRSDPLLRMAIAFVVAETVAFGALATLELRRAQAGAAAGSTTHDLTS